MKKALVCLAAAGLMAGFAGCDRDDETAVPETAPRTTEQQVQDATRPLAGQLETKSAEAQQTADDAKAAAEAQAEKQADAAKSAAGDASATAEQAQKLLDQAIEYAKENKFDLAEKALAQAEALPNLPEGVKSKIPQVRQSISAMKASGQADKAAQDLGKAAEGLGK